MMQLRQSIKIQIYSRKQDSLESTKSDHDQIGAHLTCPFPAKYNKYEVSLTYEKSHITTAFSVET